MATTPAAPNTITIDVLTDLQDGTHLKDLLQSSQGAIFSIGSEVAKFANQPVQAAAGSKPAQVVLQAAASWKTKTGIGFSLTPSATCTLAIATTSTKFPVAKSIDSSDTRDIVSGPIDHQVFINIDLDFELTVAVSGSGSVDGVGISGKANGSTTATFSYCHPVSAARNTADAVKEAFANLVLPFQPDCPIRMSPGDIGRVTFDGSLGLQLDVSYGLGSYKFSAPGVASAQQSLQAGMEKFTLPQLDVEVGAKASFSYTHTDHFGAIVKKLDPAHALLYLARSAANESDVSASLTASISSTGTLSATLDQTALAKAIDTATKTPGAGTKVAGVADQIQSSLVAKANQWLSSQKGSASLTAQLSRQTNRALLYTYAVDLLHADLVQKSWEAFANGDLRQAAGLAGMTIQPGSGVASELKRTASLSLNFFNLFKVTDTHTYFQDAYVEIGPDGSVRFRYDIGTEAEIDTKNAMKKSLIHFVATAANAQATAVQNAEVDMYIELSEMNDLGEGNRIAACLGALTQESGAVPSSPQLQDAQTAMQQFVAAKKSGALSLVCVLEPSAYRRISCSPYTGPRNDIPPALPQSQDMHNWQAFQNAAVALLDTAFANKAYLDWERFNLKSNGHDAGVPDRRNSGNPTFDGFTNFLLNSARFMNLCDDLHALGGLVGAIDTVSGWSSLLATLTAMVKADTSADWSKPAARALLALCTTTAVQTDVQSGDKNLTCTVTFS